MHRATSQMRCANDANPAVADHCRRFLSFIYNPLFISLALLLQVHGASADTFWLSNGDKFTGELQVSDGKIAKIRLPYANELLLEWKHVVAVDIQRPMLMSLDGLESRTVSSIEPAESGHATVQDGHLSSTVALADMHSLMPSRTFVRNLKLEGNFDAKLDVHHDSNQSEEWQFKGEARAEHDSWRHVLSGQIVNKTKDSERTEDNWELAYDLDRFLTQNWFIRSTAAQDEDKFSVFYRQRAFGMGPGYRFWDNELGRFDVITQFTRYQLSAEDQSLDFNAYTLAWDYKRLFVSSRFELYSKAQTQIPQIDIIDYIFDSEYGVRYRLNDWARLSLLYELDQIRAGGITSTDRHYLLGVGVSW